MTDECMHAYVFTYQSAPNSTALGEIKVTCTPQVVFECGLVVMKTKKCPSHKKNIMSPKLIMYDLELTYLACLATVSWHAVGVGTHTNQM